MEKEGRTPEELAILSDNLNFINITNTVHNYGLTMEDWAIMMSCYHKSKRKNAGNMEIYCKTLCSIYAAAYRMGQLNEKRRMLIEIEKIINNINK